MAMIQRMVLASVDINVENALIVGAIVAKSTPRIFQSTKGKSGETRSVWSFTLRDSEIDTINCEVWGSGQFITSYNEMFQIGDVVDVLSPKIKVRQPGERNELYVPQVTSPFHFVLNEGQSDMCMHEGDDAIQYMQLLHLPTKPAAGYFTLKDVLKNGENTNEYVDLLVAIKLVNPIRVIKNKDGRETSLREIMVFDNSTTDTLTIQLWENEAIQRSRLWQPRETILFIADAHLSWSNFHRSISARLNRRSIVTEDPHTAEAEALRLYAQNVPFKSTDLLKSIAANIPDPESIRTVMSIQQIKDKASSSGNENSQFTALVYAYVTHLDLDGNGKLFTYNCEMCGVESCSCDVAQERTVTLDIRISISDHTGTLSRCRLSGSFAETVLGFKAEEFSKMDIDTRGQIKWRYLLERCAVRLVVLRGQPPMASVLACRIADPTQVVANLPVY